METACRNRPGAPVETDLSGPRPAAAPTPSRSFSFSDSASSVRGHALGTPVCLGWFPALPESASVRAGLSRPPVPSSVRAPTVSGVHDGREDPCRHRRTVDRPRRVRGTWNSETTRPGEGVPVVRGSRGTPSTRLTGSRSRRLVATARHSPEPGVCGRQRSAGVSPSPTQSGTLDPDRPSSQVRAGSSTAEGSLRSPAARPSRYRDERTAVGVSLRLRLPTSLRPMERWYARATAKKTNRTEKNGRTLNANQTGKSRTHQSRGHPRLPVTVVKPRRSCPVRDAGDRLSG